MEGMTMPLSASPPPGPGGDADIAVVARLFADPTRARVLLALADGRALPATVLASEAGVSPQAVSAQLSRLRDGGLLIDEKSGRHRYYRLASEHVAAVLEALAGLAPTRPIRSLRQSTRAAALRRSRTCYDHLAGQLGCRITQGLLDQRALHAVDGVDTTERRRMDPLASPLPEHPYQLGPVAEAVLSRIGIHLSALQQPSARRRPLLRFCLDWSEQRHHVGGALGAAILTTLEQARWISRRHGDRAVTLTDLGRCELERHLGISLTD
jgi:DNA-binding transcriptional ArsR family regulator